MTVLSRKELYGLFLDSDWWINLSRLKRRLVGKCEKCGTTNLLQAHHVRYPDHWFDTELEDLRVLCRACHRKEHGISDIDQSIPPSHRPRKRSHRNSDKKRRFRKILSRRKWNRRHRAKKIGMEYISKWERKVGTGQWSF